LNDLDYLLQKELEGKLGTIMDALARGAPEGYPEYCKLVGEFRGVRYALDALANVRKQIGAEEET
jgi:hypothetical protein